MPDFRDDLPLWQQLITAAWLHRLMAGVHVRGVPAAAWRLLEVGCDGMNKFLACHIPGAAYLDTHRLEAGPFWNKVPDPALLQVMLEAGIRHDTTVILYSQNLPAAARAAHLMLYAGVKDVRLLDGGLPAWLRAGFPCAAGEPPPHPRAIDFGIPFPACPHYLINTQQAQAHLRQPDRALVSIRSWDEYTGKTSGYSYIPTRGDIPGALWGHAGSSSDMNDMSAFHNADGCMKPAAEIGQMWRAQGIHRDLQTDIKQLKAKLLYLLMW